MSLFKNEGFTFPIEYDKDCYFYNEYLIIDGETYLYKDISIITYISDSNYVNGIQISKKITMLLTFSDKNHIPYPFNETFLTGFAHFNFEKGLIPTNPKKGKTIEFMYNYLTKLTFEHRLSKHIESLKKFGKFEFIDDSFCFSDNGDLHIRNEYMGNFKEMQSKGKIIDGRKYGGYKNKIIKPYAYGFERGTKFFGIVADRVTFENITNRDVMNVLFNNLYKTGKMSEF